MIRPLLNSMLGAMAKPVRRDFWDWVYILRDGAMVVVGGVLALAVAIAGLVSGNLPFVTKDDTDP